MRRCGVGLLCWTFAFGLILASAVLAQEAQPASEPVGAAPVVQAKSVVETLAAAGNYTKLSELLKTAGVAEMLKGRGPFTVFAPSDKAFAALPKETLDGLVKDPVKLQDLLLSHVVQGKAMAADLAKIQKVKSVNGKTLAVKLVDEVTTGPDGEEVVTQVTTVAGAKVLKADVSAKNGVIHEIDRVLVGLTAEPEVTK